MDTMTKAAVDVLSERQRQISKEGWTLEHDDQHDGGELAHAAGCYALFSGSNADADDPPKYWPWNDGWKPSEYRRDLVKAAALIIAEIERIDRLAGKGEYDEEKRDE